MISSLIFSVLNQVINLWFCASFGYQCFVFAFFHDNRNFAVRVVQIAKIHTLGWANSHTRRLLSFLHPVNTKSAFVNVTIRMRISCIVWTACNTGPATNTFMGCNQHNSTGFVMTCTGWAATYARRIIAMIASFTPEFNLKLRISSIGYFHNPVAAVANGYIIFGLAGHHTVRAAYTFFSVNRHCISHDFTSLSFSNLKVTKFPLIPVPPIIGSTKTLVINCESLTPLPNARLSFLSE